MGGFTLRDMIINGWPVLSVLTVFSIISVTIMCDRIVTLRNAALNARLFMANLIKVLEEQGATRALSYCDQFRKPVAAVAAEILLATGGRDARERALQHGLQGQGHQNSRKRGPTQNGPQQSV